MALYLIGLGLNNEKDITLRGLEIIKKCDLVYLENYTSVLSCSLKKLEKLYGKKIILANRDLIENKTSKILKEALKKDIALLIIGSPFFATTHLSLLLEARQQNVPVKVIYNASVFDALGIVGLELYKYGQIISIPFPEKFGELETPYQILKKNKKMGLHTLFLLDLEPSKNKFMTINRAIEILLSIEKRKKERVFTEETLCLGCARLGWDDSVIKVGKAQELLKENFGKPPHCLIVPGKLHFLEEEALAGRD